MSLEYTESRGMLAREAEANADRVSSTNCSPVKFKRDEMWIAAGEVCTDEDTDRALRDYLKRWQDHYNVEDGTVIRIITDKVYNDLVTAYNMVGIA